MAISVADVVAEYGAYYEDAGQNKNHLYKRLHQPSVTASYFRKMPTKNTRLKYGSSEMDRVVQAFQKQFTPIGTLTFEAHPIDLFNLKIDKQEYPDDIVDSWVGFLEGEGIDRTQWPFVRWMIEEWIFPQKEEDMELNEYYDGVYAAPTSGVAGAAGASMNGLGKIFTDYAADINVITMGAVPTSTDLAVAEYVEDFVGSIPSLYRKKIDYVFMSEDMALSFNRGMRAKYNTYYLQENDRDRLADFPSVKVAGLPSMDGKNKIWATPAANRVRPVKKSDSAEPIVGEYSPRQVSIYTDWWEVLHFLHMPAVFTSDQA